MSLEKLFSVTDEMDHVYTWEYTVQEKALALLDVDDKHFALITDRREIADETGAMGDYRDTTWYFGYLYSKSDPKPAKKIPHGCYRSGVVDLSAKKQEDLVTTIEKNAGASNLTKLESITLDIGKVYLSDGNLIFDKKEKFSGKVYEILEWMKTVEEPDKRENGFYYNKERCSFDVDIEGMTDCWGYEKMGKLLEEAFMNETKTLLLKEKTSYDSERQEEHFGMDGTLSRLVYFTYHSKLIMSLNREKPKFEVITNCETDDSDQWS